MHATSPPIDVPGQIAAARQRRPPFLRLVVLMRRSTALFAGPLLPGTPAEVDWQAGVSLWRAFGTVTASMSPFVVTGGVPRFRFRHQDGKDEA